MKRFLHFILVLFFSELILFCQKVDLSTAKKVAIANFQKHNLTRNADVSEIVPFGLNNDTLIYIVKFAKKGFVIVSSYYAAPPILGQCYTDEFDTSKMPPGLLYLLEKYKYEMSGIKENKLKPTKEVESIWNKILSGEYNSDKSYTVESILVPTKWGQWDIYQDEEHPVFCTGVAMAQILYYYKCRAIGPSTYYWKNMNLYSVDAYNGLLIYDCSKECESSIFEGSSTPGLARDALVDHFGMNSSADVKWRIWHLSNWEGMLKDQIDLERPLLYSGGHIIPPYGHSWVIDGYNEDDEFHCNWGWGGTYDDFYSLGNFNNQNGSFNEIESAIFNLFPNQVSGVAIPQLTEQYFTYSSNGYTLNVPEAFGATSYDWITDHGTISGSGPSVTLYSTETANVQVKAYNDLCEIYSSYDSTTITINYGPISGSSSVCSSGTEYTAINLPPGATITWSCSENITRNSAQGSNPCTFQPNTEGNYGTINATISYNGNQYYLEQKYVWVGSNLSDPISIVIKGENYEFVEHTNDMWELCPNTIYRLQAFSSSEVYGWDWRIPWNWELLSDENSPEILIQTGDNIYWEDEVVVDVYNTSCATWLNEADYLLVTPPPVPCGELQLKLYPNPAKNSITLQLNENKGSINTLSNANINVSIIDKSGRVLINKVTKESCLDLDISNLPIGEYTVVTSRAHKSKSLKFIKIN